MASIVSTLKAFFLWLLVSWQQKCHRHPWIVCVDAAFFSLLFFSHDTSCILKKIEAAQRKNGCKCYPKMRHTEPKQSSRQLLSLVKANERDKWGIGVDSNLLLIGGEATGRRAAASVTVQMADAL